MAAQSTSSPEGWSLGSSALRSHRHAISFLSDAAINSTTEMIPANYFGIANSSSSTAGGGGGGMLFSGNSTMINTNPRISQAGSSSASLLHLDSVSGLKHDTRLAVEWSVEEQYKLKEGLVKYADEPSIMRYIKIAATLRDKTVRDVALRCSWMTRKRRNQENYNLGKKVKDWKDKMVEPSSKPFIYSALPSNVSPYPLIMNHLDHNEQVPFEALSGTTRHLLEQNNQALGQILANISTLKLQDNIDLFFCTRNNIAAILNGMREMPGIISQMPPLPVAINEELANSLLSGTSQPMMFSSSSVIHLKL